MYKLLFKPRILSFFLALFLASIPLYASVMDNEGTGIPSDDTDVTTLKSSTKKAPPTANTSETNTSTTATSTNNSAPPVTAGLTIPDSVLQRIVQSDGQAAEDRLIVWQKLINDHLSNTELEKLNMVNSFFNHTLPYATNLDTWGQREYWATPVEFIVKNKGDCEDYAIAKYYTLTKMGVPPEKLRLAYVKAIKLNQAHMVLTYYETPQQEPLILDNLQDRILYASERPDLVPVYTFNAEGFWLTPSLVQEYAQKVGTSNRMRMWLNLQNRMKRDGLM